MFSASLGGGPGYRTPRRPGALQLQKEFRERDKLTTLLSISIQLALTMVS